MLILKQNQQKQFTCRTDGTLARGLPRAEGTDKHAAVERAPQFAPRFRTGQQTVGVGRRLSAGQSHGDAFSAGKLHCELILS